MGILLSGAGELVTKDMEMAKILNAFFNSVCTGKTGFQESEVSKSESLRKSEAKKSVPIREHLNKLDGCKSKRTDRMHPLVLRELTERTLLSMKGHGD